jgi:hypothetical protein
LTTPGSKCRLIHKSSYLLGDQETSRQVSVAPCRRLATLWRVGRPQQHNPPDPARCVGNETSRCQGRTAVARQVSPVCESVEGLRSRRVTRESRSDHTHIRPDLVGQGPAGCAALTTCVDVSPLPVGDLADLPAHGLSRAARTAPRAPRRAPRRPPCKRPCRHGC